jgi:hypothetical protein
LRRKITRSV